jgi:hypothetical protein
LNQVKIALELERTINGVSPEWRLVKPRAKEETAIIAVSEKRIRASAGVGD